MAGEPDIILKRDTTRFLRRLDLVAADVSLSDQSIRMAPNALSPQAGSVVTLYDRTGEQRPGVSIRTNGGTEVATFDHWPRRGTSLELTEQEGGQRISLTSEPGTGTLSVANDGTDRTELTTVLDDQNRGGGFVSVHDEEGTERVIARADPAEGGGEISSGVLEVTNPDGNVTGRLVGADATLELTGAREGSGEVVLVGGKQAESDDVAVHVTGVETVGTGETNESIVEPDNRPRIRLDGRNARLELGREELGPEREPESGRIDIMYGVNGTAESLLSMDTAGGSGTRSGRVTFRRDDDSGSRAITASDGLVFNDALRVDRQGVVHADQAFEQALDPGGPILWTEDPTAAVGDTVELEYSLSDSGKDWVHIENGGYEFEAPVEPTGPVDDDGADARVLLQFHTGQAGQSSGRTLTVVGDARVITDDPDYSESGSIQAGRYDCQVTAVAPFETGGPSPWPKRDSTEIILQ